ncbi:hypothetical protein [Actinobaculum massiliense]|uniref:hypothetical protein n=1 Tax=Actinobaculum massiliense TaxID=202789 RepID=UPI00071AF73E|nr:hypothetical protein [Actinobaculum massiliense]
METDEDDDPFYYLPPATRALIDYIWERVSEPYKQKLIETEYEETLYNVIVTALEFVASPQGLKIPYEIFIGAENEAKEESPDDPWQMVLDAYKKDWFPDKA